MRLWVLQLVILAAIASTPFALRAVGTLGATSTSVRAACARTERQGDDKELIAACRELLAEAG